MPIVQKAQNNVPFTHTSSLAIHHYPGWNSGATYGPGETVQDPSNYQIYTCITVTSCSGPPQPSLDNAHINWILMSPQPQQYISAGINAAPETGGDAFSIAVWVKCSNTINMDRTLIAKSTWDAGWLVGSGYELGIWHYGIYFTAGQCTDPFSSDFRGGYQTYSYSGIDDGNWHLIVVTIPSGQIDNVKIYVDDFCNTGNLSPTPILGNPFLAGDLTNVAELVIGSSSPQSENFVDSHNGIIGDVSKWPFALTASEINEIWHLGHEGDLRSHTRWNDLKNSTRGLWYTWEGADKLTDSGYVYDRKDTNLYHATAHTNKGDMKVSSAP